MLGESVTAPAAASSAADAYLDTLDALAARGLDGNVSVKLSQMGLLLDPAIAEANVRRIVERAVAHDAFVRIDMEDHPTTDATLALAARAVRQRYQNVGVVLQAYLYRTPQDLADVLAMGATVRLCKGAYREPASVAFTARREVDGAYETLMERLLLDGEKPAIATHDERLIGRAVAFAREHRIDRGRFEFQMLYGVGATCRPSSSRPATASGCTCRSGPSGTRISCVGSPSGRPTVAFVLRSVMSEGRGGRPKADRP